MNQNQDIKKTLEEFNQLLHTFKENSEKKMTAELKNYQEKIDQRLETLVKNFQHLQMEGMGLSLPSKNIMEKKSFSAMFGNGEHAEAISLEKIMEFAPPALRLLMKISNFSLVQSASALHSVTDALTKAYISKAPKDFPKYEGRSLPLEPLNVSISYDLRDRQEQARLTQVLLQKLMESLTNVLLFGDKNQEGIFKTDQIQELVLAKDDTFSMGLLKEIDKNRASGGIVVLSTKAFLELSKEMKILRNVDHVQLGDWKDNLYLLDHTCFDFIIGDIFDGFSIRMQPDFQISLDEHSLYPLRKMTASAMVSTKITNKKAYMVVGKAAEITAAANKVKVE